MSSIVGYPPDLPYHLPTTPFARAYTATMKGRSTTNLSTTNITASRAPSPALTPTPSRIRSQSTNPHGRRAPDSAPPTWRSKFSAPIRRTRSLKKRWSAGAHANASTTSLTSPAPSTTPSFGSPAFSASDPVEDYTSSPELLTAVPRTILRVGRAKLVDIPASSKRAAAAERERAEGGSVAKVASPKLVGVLGLGQGDGDKIRREKKRNLRREGRRIGVFGAGSEGVGLGLGIEGGGGGERVKWYRCDIFPTEPEKYHDAEAEAKRVVVAGGGKVMEQCTYPGGFMFQMPAHLFPPLVPSSSPTSSTHNLTTYLAPTGRLRVTEFEPRLEPKPDPTRLQKKERPIPPPLSLKTGTDATTPKFDDSKTPTDLISALEYITEGENIPLPRISPDKSKSEQRWEEANSPVRKGQVLGWIQRQKGVQKAEQQTRREGVIYPAGTGWWEFGEDDEDEEPAMGRAERKLEALKPRIDSLKAKTEGPKVTIATPSPPPKSLRRMTKREVQLEKVEEADEDGWFDVYGDEEDKKSRAGSEISDDTELESLRFVAEYGSMWHGEAE